MKITNNNDNIYFGSNFRWNITPKNLKSSSIVKELFSRNSNIDTYIKTPSEDEKILYVHADDLCDKFIEKILKRNKIDFKKQSIAEALNPRNIYNRMVCPGYTEEERLIGLDTAKVEKLFRAEAGSYVGPNGAYNGIGDRYQGVKEFLATGMDIKAPSIHLQEGYPKIAFRDGRHRFAVMRDMGMRKIKFALDPSSFEIAKKWGLIYN